MGVKARCVQPGCHNEATRECEECHQDYCRRHSGWYADVEISSREAPSGHVYFVCLCERCLHSTSMASAFSPGMDASLAEPPGYAATGS
jgi:hypothetical protein